jgi:hypothetical protein
MSDVLIQRRVAVAPKSAAPQRLPIGMGLGLGAAVSLALWAALVWAVVQVL